MSSDQATLEAIAVLVRLHVGQEVHREFLPWSQMLSRGDRMKFLKDIGRLDIQTSTLLEAARYPDDILRRKAQQALAYAAVALWHIYDLHQETQPGD